MLASNPLLGIFLFLHVAGAVLAFGPTFAFPFIGSMAGKEPQHVNFALRLQHRIATTLVIPLALFQAVTGVALIWVGNIDLLSNWWLIVAITLYVIALGNSLFVLMPHLRELITMTSMAPAPAAGETPAGPPPQLLKLIGESRKAGALNALLIIVIIFLMVTRPF